MPKAASTTTAMAMRRSWSIRKAILRARRSGAHAIS
jgi:hypothetical protein